MMDFFEDVKTVQYSQYFFLNIRLIQSWGSESVR